MAECQVVQPNAPGDQVPQQSYEYTILAALLHATGKRNVWASVVECSVPRPTKGTDLISNMTIVDPSILPHEGLEQDAAVVGGVSALFFCSEAAKLPVVRKQGDLIRLHRAQANNYNGKPQLVAKLGASPCHFCLFDGAPGGPEEPYQRSSNNYTMDTHDRQFLAYLREFFHDHAQVAQGAASRYLTHIQDLQPGAYVDICCWVLAQEDSSPLDKTMYVWDGTDAKPYRLNDDTSTSEGPDGLPIFQEDSLCRRAMPLKGNVVPEIPPLGSGLPVMLYKPLAAQDKAQTVANFKKYEAAVTLPELPAVGSWVKLRNIGIVLVGGQLQGLYHRNSKWVPWQPSHQALTLLQQRFNSKHMSTWAPDEESELVARWNSPSRCVTPYTTLRMVLVQAEAGMAGMYRCLVRLLNHIPAESATFCRSGDGGSNWHFLVKLHLQDATGELDAVIFGDEGSTFFGGVAPQDLSKNQALASALQQKMELAVGLTSNREGGTWLECRLRCFFPDDAPVKDLSTARFQVVETALSV